VKQRNCLNCAFLVRHQETYRSVSFKPELSKWVDNIASLDIENRKLIKEEDLSFLGKSRREFEAWQTEYDQKKREKQASSIFASPVISDLLGHGPTDEELQELGLSDPPEACDHDYLECYHEQWTEKRDRAAPVNKGFLSEKSCCFYFSQKKVERKSLEACEKTRMHEKNQKRFWITNILVILGIASTFLLSQDVQSYIDKQFNILKHKTTTFYESVIQKDKK